MLCCFGVMVAAGCLYYVLCFSENKRRDREYGRPDPCTDQMSERSEAMCNGLTDVKNRQFRYAF